MKPLIYLASPYTSTEIGVKEQRAREVARVAGKLIEDGYNVFCPIAHSHFIADQSSMPAASEGCGDYSKDPVHRRWMEVDIAVLKYCDELWVLKLPGWDSSTGVQQEIDYAKQHNKNINLIELNKGELQASPLKYNPRLELPKEFNDVIKVLEFGATKYAVNNWLKPNGKGAGHKENHDSMFHHLAESFAGRKVDKESGLHPLLHLACRALMAYTRTERGIVKGDENE